MLIPDTSKYIYLLVTTVLLLCCVRTASAADAPATVTSVDLGRYQGKWHEIARLPNRFQKQCAGFVTADYSLNADGTIKVLNRCQKKDGSWDEATGKARLVDQVSKAKLEVSFVSLFGFQLFWGAYWIIELDEAYQWVVVGHPQRKYGWILSRTPVLNDETMHIIKQRLRKDGYDPAAFLLTKQQ